MNYYEILHISKTASQSEIRDSYKKLIKQYHPDIYTGSKEYADKVTAELNTAYAILSNEQSRRDYDISLNEVSPTYNYTSYQSYKKTDEYVEEPHDTIDEMIRKRVHDIVDEKSANMSPSAKKTTVFLIIIFALFFTILAIQDFIDIVRIREYAEQIKLEQERKVMDSYYQEMLMNTDTTVNASDIFSNTTDNSITTNNTATNTQN